MLKYPHMIQRRFWLDKIKEGWQHRSILWLSGVRRVGKTSLCKSLDEIEYFDCELPRVRRMMEDPQSFLEDLRGHKIVLDEIHRLSNPAEVLKIASDHYPDIKVIATGSSTLGASAKFKDTLAGRKLEIWLTPMISFDLADFKQEGLNHRFARGGLPPFFMAEQLPERDFQEWMEAYWAKDIQELFRLERRNSFLKFAELLMMHSGGIFEATTLARPCEVSRTTISNYLAALEATYVVHVIRPFSSHRPTEIISAPKVYAFDTGFICYYRGWEKLRREDLGVLWEHFVLNEIQARFQTRNVLYWRDKRGHEVDFILASRRSAPMSIECKWSSQEFDASNVKAFRRQYKEGNNFVVAQDVNQPFSQTYDGVKIKFVGLTHLIDAISEKQRN